MDKKRKMHTWVVNAAINRREKPFVIEMPGFEELVRVQRRPGGSVDFSLGRGALGHPEKLQVAANDVVEVELEDGITLFLAAERLEGMSPSRSPGADDVVKIPGQWPLDSPAERGLGSLVIKALHLLDVDSRIADRSATAIAAKLEEKLIGGGGLYPWDDENSIWSGRAVDKATQFSSGPILVFIHGTASTTEGSFSALWSAEGREEWARLLEFYGSNIYAFEHRTLSESPVDNAVQLIESLEFLPPGSTIHLVSHSRGGLVGELLCRGQRDSAQPFDQHDYDFFDPQKNPRLAAQIKRIDDNGEAAAANEKQIRQLKKLNGLLRKKQFRIERFLRVACPVRGTTLASARLDIYLSGLLNLFGLVTGMRANPVYSFLQTVVIELARERADPASLPGLEAMMPLSATIQMLNSSQSATAAHLAVIAGDIEARGVFRKLAIFLLDRFYRGDHDLVVDTAAMEGGTLRGQSGLMSEQGEEVNHFSYFKNRRSREALTAALVEETLPQAFSLQLPDKPVPRYIKRSATPEKLPTVIIVPGISGSNLAANDERIWLSLRLMLGGFRRLRYRRDNDSVSADGVIGRYYDALAEFLSRSHNVVCFDYDWRKSILEASAGLATEIAHALDNSQEPVRIVAHSMGGLVARAVMADHKEVWQRMVQRQGSRLLMLGTPLQGSYSITRLLTGEESLTGLLSLVDLVHDESQWLDILRQFPGVLELLPRHGGKAFYQKERWEIFSPILNRKEDAGFLSGLLAPIKTWSPPTKKALQEADNTWRRIDSARLDARYVCYVAGLAKETPIDVRTDGQKIKFIGTHRGDGRVPWDFGIPEGIPHWYMEAEHGALANTESAFEAIGELIENGTTDKLSRTEPRQLSRALDARFTMTKPLPAHLPSEAELGDAFMGVSRSQRQKISRSQPKIRVSVSHGDLAFSRSAIIVGHYQDDAIVNAEAALDRQLKGRLSARLSLGLYPGKLGSNDVLLSDDSRHLHGAVVIGLGKIGSLTPGRLRSTYRDGVLKYVLLCAEARLFSNQPVQLSSLLVGSNDSGIPLEDALRAMITGVIEANEILRRQPDGGNGWVEALEFVEIYEEEAALAQKILLRMMKNRQLGKAMIVDRFLQESEGGFRRLAADDTSWWERLSIRATENGGLTFNFLSKRARAESELVATQRRIVDSFVERATRSTGSNIKTAQALYELLVPRDFKSHALDNRNMLLVVDEQSAVYPWELLEYRDHGNSLAPAAEAGMIRQLVTDQYLRHPAINRNHRALVVGDPPSFAPELPGAQQEAQMVWEKLHDFRFEASSLIRKSGLEIIAALMSDDYQVLHLAGHGVFNYIPELPQADSADNAECLRQCGAQPEPVTGMILGDGMYLTPAEIAQMPTVPELVFINCCYLGKSDEYRDLLSASRHRLAANIATQLIRNGVVAVVAAGWAVDDDAATAFADVFYTAMLNGESFGNAVRMARAYCRNRYPHSNTWGAYQCYGDPNYQLRSATTNATRKGSAASFVSLHEAVMQLKNIVARAKVANQVQNDRICDELESLQKAIPDVWMDNAELLSALGTAYGELEQFDQAVVWYRKALRTENAEVSIRSVEQLANFEARLSLKKSRVRHADAAAELIDAAINRLELVNSLCNFESGGESGQLDNTIERLSLLGSCYKRKAMISTGAKREVDLQNMYKFYEDADAKYRKKHDGIYTYPRFGWLSAWWVLSRISREKRYKDTAALKKMLQEVRLDQERQPDKMTQYWSAISAIEFDLLEALMNENLPEIQETLSARLQQQFRIASSPRQISSTLDSLHFFSAMLEGMPTSLKPQKAAIGELIAFLEGGE